MRKFTLQTFTLPFWLLFLTACQKGDSLGHQNEQPDTTAYYVKNVTGIPSPGKTFLSVKSYQQTTEYTCGPAAVISLLHFYGKEGDEMTIASEMGTSTTTGTSPAQMNDWLSKHGFNSSWKQEGTIEMLRENLKNKIPVLIEWSDWGGHWVLVIGYDTRNTVDPMDDVIIFADPYDRHDDNRDGITWFNAQRFYCMWYDSLLFGTILKRIYIDATPL